MKSIYESARSVLEAAAVTSAGASGKPGEYKRGAGIAAASANVDRAKAAASDPRRNDAPKPQAVSSQSKASDTAASNTLAASNTKSKDAAASNTLASANSKAKEQNASDTLASANFKASAKPVEKPSLLDRAKNAISSAASTIKDKMPTGGVALGNKAREENASNKLAAANVKAKEQNASDTLASANAKSQQKPQAAATPAAKPAAKPGQATMADGPSQDKLNATQRSAEKSGPDTDSMKKGIAAGAPAATSSVDTTNKEASATKPNDSGGMRGNFSTAKDSGSENTSSSTAGSGSPMAGVKHTNTVAAADKPVEAPTSGGSGSPMAGVKPSTVSSDAKPQAAATPAPAPAADNTVKSGSGGTVTTSDGSPLKTRTDDEIAKQSKKGRGAAMESINKKFNITDALYQSVMEVMKKDKGSIPRNDKEKELAAAYGDPKRITHGDVLTWRGVTREEVEQIDELSSNLLQRASKKSMDKFNVHYIKAGKTKDTAAKNAEHDKADVHLAKSDKFDAAAAKSKASEDSKAKNQKAKSLGYVDEGMMSTAKKMTSKILAKMGGGSDKDHLKRLQKDMGMPQTGKKPVNESKDTPGNGYAHQCAIHVKSESFGEGRTITTQHADPDAYGNIEWYDVMFEHGIEKQVPTDTLEILVSENHMHSKKKKGM